MPAQTSAATDIAYYSQHDTGPPLVRTLRQGNGDPISLATATGVTIIISFARGDHYYSPYTRKVNRAACVIEGDPADGLVSWTPATGDLDVPGEYHFVYEITRADGSVQTVPAHTYEQLVVKTKPGGFEQL